MSVARTAAPFSRRSSTAASPDRAMPTTSTFAPDTCIASPQFQRGQGEEGHDKSGDPEAGDNFRFLPAQRLEVMMDRRHLEDSFTPQLIAPHLQDHRERFDDIHAAD